MNFWGRKCSPHPTPPPSWLLPCTQVQNSLYLLLNVSFHRHTVSFFFNNFFFFFALKPVLPLLLLVHQLSPGQFLPIIFYPIFKQTVNVFSSFYFQSLCILIFEMYLLKRIEFKNIFIVKCSKKIKQNKTNVEQNKCL